MHEYIARPFYYFEVHLVYASIVWLAAWGLTSVRIGSATTKYWIWVATSLNFIVPVGAVLDKVGARHLSWATPISFIGFLGVVVSENLTIASALGMVWLIGAIMLIGRLTLRIRAEHRATQPTNGRLSHRTREGLVQGVLVRFVPGRGAPAVDGVWHPHISLPECIEEMLTGPELDAVLLHELTHARRRDNLIRLIHEIGLCILWFHPLMWISGHRMALYRELSCDESVIRSARGRDLVSALAKLADPEGEPLLESSASSYIHHRLTRLDAIHPRSAPLAANAALLALFGCAVGAGIYGTVAHTACCFTAKAAVPVIACERK